MRPSLRRHRRAVTAAVTARCLLAALGASAMWWFPGAAPPAVPESLLAPALGVLSIVAVMGWAASRDRVGIELLALEIIAVGALSASAAPRWWLLPYLAAPLAALARRGAWRTALGLLLGVTCLSLLADIVDTSTDHRRDIRWILTCLIGLLVTIVVALLRPRAEAAEPDPGEHAYADAHRLLSELNLVARQLSLGLDPHTLATALVEELQAIAHGSTATVLVRSAGGRFVPVVGDSPNPLTESVVMDAWVSADVVRRARSGVTVLAMPLRMGERVVAVAVLADTGGTGALGDDIVVACQGVIAKAGPRLASALLFDDVRRLATVDERHRLAREIHDGIAQDMASVGYQIDDIGGDATPEVAERLRALREHLTQLVSELRLSIFDLRTGVDQDVGLSRTLADYVQRVGKQSGLVVHVSADESPHRLSLATEVELLRIVQEAVTNVRRHAKASHIWLTVTVDPPSAYVSVRDDGTGLGHPRPDSMGITGMKERAARIGAKLTVRDRDDGPGTQVELFLEPRRVTTLSSSTITHTDH